MWGTSDVAIVYAGINEDKSTSERVKGGKKKVIFIYMGIAIGVLTRIIFGS